MKQGGFLSCWCVHFLDANNALVFPFVRNDCDSLLTFLLG